MIENHSKNIKPEKNIDWANYIEKYRTPTILKERLLKPYFENTRLDEPILDVGCGTGYFSEIFTNRQMHTVGIDPNINLKENDYFHFIKEDFLQSTIDQRFKTILLINILSVLPKEARLNFLQKASNLKFQDGKIYFLTMNADLYKNDFQTDELSVKKLNNDLVNLEFKLVDGNHINFNDNIISDNEINQIIKQANLKIIEKVDFQSDKIKEPIYKLYILE